MRPQKGMLVCIRCSRQGRGRAGLDQALPGAPRVASTMGFDPTLTPHAGRWRPPGGGAPHPQLGLFPYDEVREGQKRMAREVTMAVREGKHLVAHAPTGIGKTAASLAPALQHALETKGVVLFLTSRQSQHRIAIETLRGIQERRGARFTVVDLVAKRDMCLRREAAEMHPGRFPDFCARETRTRSCQFLGDVDAASLAAVRAGVFHVEELMHASKLSGLCPHLVALAAGREAQVIVADYNHLFSEQREQSLERLALDLSRVTLIVDEAHNLPDRIRANYSHRITPFLLDQAASEARDGKAKAAEQDIAALRAALARISEQAQAAGRGQARLRESAKQTAVLAVADLHAAFEAERNRGLFSTHRTIGDAAQELAALAARLRRGTETTVHAEEVAEALAAWDQFAEGALRFVEWEGSDVALHIRLLDASLPARGVFNAVHSAILMSGTLRPPEMARDTLGLAEGRTTLRVYQSPFPPANRPIFVAQGYSTRFGERGEALWSRVAATIAGVAQAARGNVAVFAPSYAVLRDVRLALDAHELGKESIVEEPGWTKADRDRVLDTLEGARQRTGAVLLAVMGGSFSEGVDFRDNLLSAILVVGLPLAPPDLEVEAGIAHLEKRVPGRGRAYGYTLPAMTKVLQAMGRGIRGPEDRCAVVLLDERYLGPPYRALLPEDAPLVGAVDPVPGVAAFLRANEL
jgi:DNA excision repair protein ERCC-2